MVSKLPSAGSQPSWNREMRCLVMMTSCHGDVLLAIREGNHQSVEDSPLKGPITQALMFSFMLA